MNQVRNPVDVIARLAEAWDGRGRNAFTAPTEHEALLGLARLPLSKCSVPWHSLSADDRRALIVATRRAVELGRACAWVFGEGRGA